MSGPVSIVQAMGAGECPAGVFGHDFLRAPEGFGNVGAGTDTKGCGCPGTQSGCPYGNASGDPAERRGHTRR